MTAQFQFSQSLPHKKADFVKKKPIELGVLQDAMQWCCRHLVVVELCKVVDDDGDGQCHHQDAADRTTCSDQLAKT